MKLVRFTAALGAAIVLSATALAGAQGTGGSPGHKAHAMMMGGPHQLTVHLTALNGSGETGKAVLKDTAGGLSVSLTLMGGPKDAQPAHIHKGTCAKLDPKPEYPLDSVVGGTSKTVIKGLKLAALLASPTAVNVHKSTSEIPTYVACGNIATTMHGKM